MLVGLTLGSNVCQVSNTDMRLTDVCRTDTQIKRVCIVSVCRVQHRHDMTQMCLHSIILFSEIIIYHHHQCQCVS